MQAAFTVLGVDVGQKKIGVALGNTLTASARPLTIIYSEVKKTRFERLAALIQEWGPDAIVVGLPLTLEGLEQPASQAARRFARQVQGRFQLPVHLQDERYSSMEAQHMLGTHQDEDAMAAVVIVQRFLASGKAVLQGDDLQAAPHPAHSEAIEGEQA